jgi:hypothetical protein
MREEPTKQQVTEAVRECIKAMKGALAGFSSPSVGTLEPDGEIDKWVVDACTEGEGNFKKNFGLWNSCRDQVLEASRAIGRIAEILAVLDGSGQIGKAHLKDAIIAVRPHCRVGAVSAREEKRRALCPDDDDMHI